MARFKIYQVTNKDLFSNNKILHVLTCLLLVLGVNIKILKAQATIDLQEVIIGKANVVATSTISLKSGFHAVMGSDFHASIGTPQGQYSSVTITSNSSNNTPPAGSSTMNYVKTISYREAKTTIPTGSFKNMEEIQYIDGLGRPVQNIQVGTTPGQADLIQPILYDVFGREAKKTLPYTEAKSGNYRTPVSETRVNDYYSSTPPSGVTPDAIAYTQKDYDNSPLNRILSITGPGNDWKTNSKKISFNYLPNGTTKNSFQAPGTGSFSAFQYPLYSLYATQTIDEQGNTSCEYTDKLGQIVFKESMAGSNWLQSRYIYDDFGQLRGVMPPNASDPNDTTQSYQYYYDTRHRLKEKRIPGGGFVRMVYDKLDRLRFTQNRVQAANNEWSFIKYDQLGRPVITGILSNYSSGRAALESATINAMWQSEKPISSSSSGYTNNSYPTSTTDVTIWTITYYDDYSFLNISGMSDSLKSLKYDIGSYNILSKLATSNKGRVTGSMTKVLSDAADVSSIPKNNLYSAIYYDKYGHVLRTVSENILLGKDVTTNILEDITYLVTQSKQEHYKGSESIMIEKFFEYDHVGRLLATLVKVKSQPKFTQTAQQYNEIGELITKYLHSDDTTSSRSFRQKSDFTYNIRGWITQINNPDLSSDNDLFGMQLFYNTTTGMGGLVPSEGLYNGNIVGMKWQIKGDTMRGYKFIYDSLNRVLQSKYADGASLGGHTDYYSELIKGYDKAGNIQGLKRNFNSISVDSLNYKYINNLNKLAKITDSGTANGSFDDYPGTSQSYGYDSNGNMTKDGSKNFTVSNIRSLNLPQVLDFGSNKRIFYHYAAGGAKLAKHSIPGSGSGTLIQYVGNVVYIDGTLSYILTEEGRLIADGTGANRKFLNEYNLKDHLGNARLTFMGSNLGNTIDIVQTTNYYPFGLVMNQVNSNTWSDYKINKYLYNGKERQDDKMISESLNWYDYGARFYDPQIGRFTTEDPLAEKTPDYTPYNYVRNNPILKIDPTGKWDVTVHVYNNRAKYGYGVAIVTDIKGNEVFRFNVLARGTGGRDRTKDKADTPLGVYNIPGDNPWLSGKSRKSFGPNYRLNMTPVSGEASDITTRDLTEIRIHGGGQEKEGTWEPLDNPALNETWGCLRAWDEDMAEFKDITENLTANDPIDRPGKVTILDDFKPKKSKTWMGVPYKSNVTKSTYKAPGKDASDEEKENWNNLVNSILNR